MCSEEHALVREEQKQESEQPSKGPVRFLLGERVGALRDNEACLVCRLSCYAQNTWALRLD
jgi:hypothetical protein